MYMMLALFGIFPVLLSLILKDSTLAVRVVLWFGIFVAMFVGSSLGWMIQATMEPAGWLNTIVPRDWTPITSMVTGYVYIYNKSLLWDLLVPYTFLLDIVIYTVFATIHGGLIMWIIQFITFIFAKYLYDVFMVQWLMFEELHKPVVYKEGSYGWTEQHRNDVSVRDDLI